MIDEKIKQLREITSNWLLIEYYSHTNCDMYKILNEYTKYKEDKIVLSSVSEGIEKALDSAIEQITIKKELFFGTDMEKLATRIYKFIETYAASSPNYEPNTGDERYTCPDVYEMLRCADSLTFNQIPSKCFSEWGCGGYLPYTSKEGKEEHDILVNEIYFLINKK